jgi:hypothetical protein
VQLANDSVVDLLNPGQCAALTSLTAGETISQAADAAGVDRHTVTRWIKMDPLFRAAYNAWRQELIESTRARLLRAAEVAAGVVNAAVAKGDARIAMSLLTKLGMATPAACETTDPALLREQITDEREREEHLLLEARRSLSGTRFDRQILRDQLQELEKANQRGPR